MSPWNKSYLISYKPYLFSDTKDAILLPKICFLARLVVFLLLFLSRSLSKIFLFQTFLSRTVPFRKSFTVPIKKYPGGDVFSSFFLGADVPFFTFSFFFPFSKCFGLENFMPRRLQALSIPPRTSSYSLSLFFSCTLVIFLPQPQQSPSLLAGISFSPPPSSF